MNKNSEQETIEALLEQLEAQVAWFSSDDFVLEEATERYRTTKALADKIHERIETVRHEVEEVVKAPDTSS